MAGIKRFPNPGSNIDMFIHIFKTTFPILEEKQVFSLYDISSAMIEKRLVSSEGHIGEKAFALSLREDASRDPIYNQSKMYAELYRSLGWICSSEDKKLIFNYTEYGKYVGRSTNTDNKLLFKEAVMGIVDPNNVLDKKDGLRMRPFKHFLNTIKALDNKIVKLELILGPMRYSDDNESDIELMLKEIKSVRGNYNSLLSKIEEISKCDKIAKNTMENYTRIPIATLSYLGWVKKQKSDSLYPKSRNMELMTFTSIGESDLELYNSLIDIRLNQYKSLSDIEKQSIVKVAFFQQLNRSDILNNYPFGDYNQDNNILKKRFGNNPNFLFSPYQLLPYNEVNNLLGVESENSNNYTPLTKASLIKNKENINTFINNSNITDIKLKSMFNTISEDAKKTRIYKEIISNKNVPIKELVDILIDQYKTANQDVFYPLVGDLFNILGFNCVISRAGTNYERYDGIIISDNSIPMEIKSPGEELNISVKAIRQALENKIILLSRENHPTKFNITSLAVGFYLPSNRAEVMTLVDDIKNTYDVNIGVIDFPTLLEVVINKVLYNRTFTAEEIENLKGMINIEYDEN